MRIGIVCPYSLDVPGGVQGHVVDLAQALRRLGHSVSVLAPAEEGTELPDFVTSAGKALGVPYNGSVARVTFGPVTYARARRWLAENSFDVLHLHEPTTFSISVLALLAAEGPIVATFHTSTERSRTLHAFGGVLRPLMEKVTARIAVSATARRVQVEHLGGDATEIPNGVDVARFAHGPRLTLDGPTVGFVGRFSEPRKGMAVLQEALDGLGARLVVVGRGDAAALPADVEYLGAAPDDVKAAMLRSVDVFCAPNLGGESFGMVLTEAMAAGAPVVASDLESFRRVLDGAGVLVPTGSVPALRAALGSVLADPARRAAMSAAGRVRAARFDWPVVAGQVLQVYQAAIAADPRQAVAP